MGTNPNSGFSFPELVTENPFGAAQRFLERNDLPTTYVDQVVDFIQKNTAGVNLGSGNNDHVDPFTGMDIHCRFVDDN